MLNVCLMATALATPVVALAVLLARDEPPGPAEAARLPRHATTAPAPAASAPSQFPPWPEPRPSRDQAPQEPAPTF